MGPDIAGPLVSLSPSSDLAGLARSLAVSRHVMLPFKPSFVRIAEISRWFCRRFRGIVEVVLPVEGDQEACPFVRELQHP